MIKLQDDTQYVAICFACHARAPVGELPTIYLSQVVGNTGGVFSHLSIAGEYVQVNPATKLST